MCVMQCVSSCTERQCSQNKVVSRGIQAPLEVFYTGELPMHQPPLPGMLCPTGVFLLVRGLGVPEGSRSDTAALAIAD